MTSQTLRPSPVHTDPALENLLDRVHRLVVDAHPDAAATPPGTPGRRGGDKANEWTTAARPGLATSFVPRAPETLRQAGLSESEVEAFVLKLLLHRNDTSGRDMADHLRLPFLMLEGLLRQLKVQRLVFYRAACPMNDYLYQLTDLGRERARRFAEHCAYFDAVPVPLDAYIASVYAQSITKQHPTREDLERALGDLKMSPQLLARLGPAVNSGRGMLLYGAPGNGKTSVAERVTKAFGEYVWIPRAISVDGVIIQLFDQRNHEEVPLKRSATLLDQSQLDRRWVRIRRPTIVVGGELTMDSLELTHNLHTNVCEAPVQMKSNCGTLVIDDFGRQRMPIDELLNRWIVPLEKRHDYLNLPTGKKIQVPFDQLIVFSTNLQPKDLIDEAFLRRIPYKVEIHDPTEPEFRELFKTMCTALQVPYCAEAVDELIRSHYRGTGRSFRFCHPRDLLLQVRNHCMYQGLPVDLTPEYLDFAAHTYFALF